MTKALTDAELRQRKLCEFIREGWVEEYKHLYPNENGSSRVIRHVYLVHYGQYRFTEETRDGYISEDLFARIALCVMGMKAKAA